LLIVRVGGVRRCCGLVLARARTALWPAASLGLLALFLSGVSCRSLMAAIRACENGFVQLPGVHCGLAIARGRVLI